MPKEAIAFILGPKKFYNESLKALIEGLGIDCKIGLHAEWEKLLKSSDKIKIILLDYQGQAIENLWNEYIVKAQMIENDYTVYWVLHNVKKEGKIEKKALVSGIKGVFYQDDGVELIKRGIPSVINGELWYPRGILSDVIKQYNLKKTNPTNNDLVNLTEREKEILIKIGEGKKNEEISKELFISNSTVKSHIYNIFRKINVPNRIQAALWSAENLLNSNNF